MSTNTTDGAVAMAPVPLDPYANRCLDLALERSRELGHNLDESRRDQTMVCPDCRHTLTLWYGDTSVHISGTAIALRCGVPYHPDIRALLFEEAAELEDLAMDRREEAFDLTPPRVGDAVGE